MDVTAQDRKALIDQAGCIIINSGNVLYDILQTPDEICKSFCGVVKKWIKEESTTSFDRRSSSCLNEETLSISSQPSIESLNESRDDLKITVKLFLVEYQSQIVVEAVTKVIEDLQCKRLDTVLLSFPPTSVLQHETFRTIKYEEIKDLWIKLQEMVESGLISQLGVCDFDTKSLKELHEMSQVKPVINQITLEQCCAPPQDLVAFSTSSNIDLLTHNDPRDILPPLFLEQILPEKDSSGMWKAAYLLKYSCVFKLREIVKSKGYILCMKREVESSSSLK